MAIIMAIGGIVGKLIEARRESERIKNIYSEYRKDVEAAGNDNRELIRIRSLLNLMNDKKTLHKDALAAQSQLLGILGLEYKDRGLINDRLRVKIGLLKEAAKAETYANAYAGADKDVNDLARDKGLTRDEVRAMIGLYNKAGGGSNGIGTVALFLDKLGKGKGFQNFTGMYKSNEIESFMRNIGALNSVMNDSNTNIKSALTNSSNYEKIVASWGGSGGSTAGGGITTGGSGGGQADDAAEAALQALASSLSASSGDLLSPEAVSKLAGIKRYVPIEGVRDTTFDYKKSDLDILEEKKELLSDYIKNLKDEAPHALELIKQKEGELTTLSEALKLQELKDDIEKFKDEIDDLNNDILLKSIDGFTGLANSIDSIANSWKRVASADMNGWERMVAIINAMGDSVKGITSAWEAYSTIKGLIDAKEKASALQKVATATMEASAAGVEAEANIAAGSAKTFNAHAGIPFVGIGIAAAGIAAMIALIAKSRNSIPKYAEGGIIGGTSYTGDKVLGRFNSGEMVITRADQRNLNRAIKSGNFGGGNVEFVIKGKDLVGTLNQQQQRASRR